MKIKIDSIKIGERFRKDLGDLASLAESIKLLGLLHAIVIDSKNNLICGCRRIEACKMLGWTEIAVNIVDLDTPLLAERDENDERKDFTVSEKVAIAAAFEPIERAKAKERQKAAGAQGKQGGRGKKKAENPSEKISEGFSESAEIVASKVGMSAPTLRKAKAVCEAAEKKPALKAVVEKMDATGNVAAAYRAIQKPKVKPEWRIEDDLHTLEDWLEQKNERWTARHAGRVIALLRTWMKRLENK